MKAFPELCRLGPGDLAAVLALQDEAGRGVREGFLRARHEQEIVAVLSDGGPGGAWGVFVDERLCAFAILRLGAPGHGPALPRVPDEDWPQRVGWLEGTLVHPDHRGRGWQSQLLAARLGALERAGVPWAASGTHAENHASRRNLLRAGFALVGMRTFTDQPVCGWLRPVGRGLPVAGPAWRVRDDDTGTQRQLLDQGLVGAGLEGDLVLFRRWTEGARPAALSARAAGAGRA